MQRAFLTNDSPQSLVNSIVRTSNVHKLKKLATTMVAVIDMIEMKKKYVPAEDLLKIYEILMEYSMLMRWIKELSKKQLFWNFWSIRSKVKTMEERADDIARILKRATAEEERRHGVKMLPALKANMKAEDDFDLKEYEDAKLTLALSLAAALNDVDDAGNEGLDVLESVFATEHIAQLLAAPAPAAVQEIVRAEEQDNAQACEELYRTMVEETSIPVQDALRIAHELADSTDEPLYSPEEDGISEVEVF